ncbi:MAG: hypothetical protein ACE5OS_07880 [Anaerolineae bacterium]
MYRAVVALVDDRMQEIRVVRQDYDRLAKGQERIEARMDRVEAALERLAEAQARTEERVERLEATVQQLAEAQARTEERLNDLIRVVAGMQDRLGAVYGRQPELTYKERAGAYFGPLLRHVRVVSLIEIEDDLETQLSDEEFQDLLLLDLLVRGQPRYLPDVPQVWLAVEVSGVIDRHDVERARRRAGYLNKAGYIALPAVAGEQAAEGAEAMAQDKGVLLVLDGRASFWEQALEQALAGK